MRSMATKINVLTNREKQIALLCSKGKISKEIATELGISVRTVETHKTHIYNKLGINNIVELMRYVADHDEIL